jgi:hypothetical protein
MAARYSDQDIAQLIEELKPFPEDYRSRMQLRPKRGHKEQELDVQGANGSEFRLILRQSNFNPLDFSIILAYRPPNINILFRLGRYDGRSHEHTNRIEGNKFYDFHIHMATQRYQELGTREDGYAEPTDRFSDFASALQCMLNDCGFDIPEDPQGRLFEEV